MNDDANLSANHNNAVGKHSQCICPGNPSQPNQCFKRGNYEAMCVLSRLWHTVLDHWPLYRFVPLSYNDQRRPWSVLMESYSMNCLFFFFFLVNWTYSPLEFVPRMQIALREIIIICSRHEITASRHYRCCMQMRKTVNLYIGYLETQSFRNWETTNASEIYRFYIFMDLIPRDSLLIQKHIVTMLLQ